MEKLIYIKWIDSGFSIRSDIWQTKEEIKNLLEELKEVETIGFLIEEHEDWIVLGQSINLDMLRGGYIIYKKNIVEMYELSERKKNEI